MPPTTQDDVDQNPGSVDVHEADLPLVEIPDSGIRREPGGAPGAPARVAAATTVGSPSTRSPGGLRWSSCSWRASRRCSSSSPWSGRSRTPGNYSFKAKWADWLRGHHAEYVVREFENVYFKTKQVKKGGTVTKLHALPGIDDKASATTRAPTATLPPHIDKPKAVSLVVSPPAPGEGRVAAHRPARARSARHVRVAVPCR